MNMTTRIAIRDQDGRVVGERVVVRYGALLKAAHGRGLKSIGTELLQIPSEEPGHLAVVHAAVEMEDGSVFCGIGDASPESVRQPLLPCLLRLAETRAKARCLRDALGVSEVSVEELGDDDAEFESPSVEPANVRPMRGPGWFSPMTEAQTRYLRRLLAGRGVRGQAADRAICDAVGAASLEEVDRHSASGLIDELKQPVEATGA